MRTEQFRIKMSEFRRVIVFSSERSGYTVAILFQHERNFCSGPRQNFNFLSFYLLVQHEVQVVSSVTGRFLRPARRSKQTEEDHSNRRRGPATLPLEKFAFRGEITGQDCHHVALPKVQPGGEKYQQITFVEIHRGRTLERDVHIPLGEKLHAKVPPQQPT